jgi:hypothetical protein
MLFQVIWGAKWIDQIAAVPMDLALQQWTDGLADIPEDRLRMKLAWCRDHLAWPPSIAEVRMAAEQSRPKTRAAWIAWGEAQGESARPGEGWDDFVGRLGTLWDQTEDATHG